MKKLLLSAFLISGFLPGRAQSYIPFPGNMVIYGYSHLFLSMGDEYWYPHRTEINGDTLIGAYHYAIVYDGTSSVTLRGGIRNDTLNKKVYFYSFSTGTEKLFYDFDLSVGDTVNASSGYGFYDQLVTTELPPIGTLDTAWVTSIDSVYMAYDGLYHKRFRFNGIYMGWSSSGGSLVDTTDQYWMQPSGSGSMIVTSLMEGVGQIRNPLSYFGEFEYSNTYEVWCASINGIPVITTTGGPPPPFLDNMYCDQLFVNVKEEEQAGIQLFPNPVSENVHIVSPVAVSVILQDVLGRKLFERQLNAGESELDLSMIPAGIYVIRMTDPQQKKMTRKIVKR